VEQLDIVRECKTRPRGGIDENLSVLLQQVKVPVEAVWAVQPEISRPRLATEIPSFLPSLSPLPLSLSFSSKPYSVFFSLPTTAAWRRAASPSTST
jgi:hypothetical protein